MHLFKFLKQRGSYSLSAKRASVLSFFVTSLVLCCYFYALFPGILNEDHFQLVLASGGGTLLSWQSNLYSLFALLLVDITGSSAPIGFAQIFLSSSIFSFIIYQFVKHRVRWELIALSITFFLFIPSFYAYIFSYSRDVIFSWLTLLLLVLLFLKERSRQLKEFTTVKFEDFSILLISVALGAMRIDGHVFMWGSAIYLLWSKKSDMRSIFNIFVLFIFSSLLVNWLIYMPFNKQYVQVKRDKAYYVTAIINPLSYIMRKRELALSTQDVQAIEEVIPIEELLKYDDDFNIQMVHDGKLKEGFNSIGLFNFFKVSTKIALMNFDLFIKNRFTMGVNTLGIGGDTQYLLDDEVRPEIEATKSRNSWVHSKTKKAFLGFFSEFFFSPLLRNIFWSSAPMTLFILIFSFIRRYRALQLCCGLLLIRSFIVFLLAPAPHFLYLYSNFLFGLVSLGFLSMEMRSRKTNNQ